LGGVADHPPLSKKETFREAANPKIRSKVVFEFTDGHLSDACRIDCHHFKDGPIDLARHLHIICSKLLEKVPCFFQHILGTGGIPVSANTQIFSVLLVLFVSDPMRPVEVSYLPTI
jgi:hypothetical protein